MGADFAPLSQLLDSSQRGWQVFFRDDDAGWADDRLAALCATFASLEVPLDIAVIPTAVTADTRSLLRGLLAEYPQLLHLHQHGFAHRNHQLLGRKCEFGPDRNEQQQASDIAEGRARLQDQFGSVIEPVFTPPWNRCSQATADVLTDLDFKILSRDTTAAPVQTSLREVPVHIDWLKRTGTSRLGAGEWPGYLAGAFRLHSTVGIMLHHEQMDDNELRNLTGLLFLLKSAANVTLTSIVGVKSLDCAATNKEVVCHA